MTLQERVVAPVGLALLVALAGCGAVGPGLLGGGTPTPTAGGGTTPGAAGTPTATPAVGTPGADEGALVTVVGVISADTLSVEYEDGTTAAVTLAGVAAPRAGGGNDPADYEGVPDVAAAEDCLTTAGEEAITRTRSSLRGEAIRIVVADNASADGDAEPVYAYVDGTLYNLQLLRDGDARVAGSGFEHAEAFATAAAAARADERGLWRCTAVDTPTPGATDTPTPTPTPVSETGLRVVEVSATADDLNDEYIVFKNTGSLPLDLEGWRVRDGDGNTYTFKSGTVLETNETLVLHTGGGSKTETDRYWWRSEEVWDDDGETITVFNDNGDKVYVRTYD